MPAAAIITKEEGIANEIWDRSLVNPTAQLTPMIFFSFKHRLRVKIPSGYTAKSTATDYMNLLSLVNCCQQVRFCKIKSNGKHEHIIPLRERFLFDTNLLLKSFM